MAQRPQRGIDGVEEPELPHFLRRDAGLKLALRPRVERHRSALFLQDVDHASQEQHQGRAGADLGAGRNKLLVVDEIAGAIAANARDGQRLHVACVFLAFSSRPVLSSGIIVVSAMKRVGWFASGSASVQLGAPGRWGGMARRTVRLSLVGGKISAMLRGTGRGSLSGMLKGSPSGKMPRA